MEMMYDCTLCGGHMYTFERDGNEHLDLRICVVELVSRIVTLETGAEQLDDDIRAVERANNDRGYGEE